MKRYGLDSFDCIVEMSDGGLCMWQDVQSLKAERDRLVSEVMGYFKMVAAERSELNKVKAERDRLRNSLAEIEGYASSDIQTSHIAEIARKALGGGEG